MTAASSVTPYSQGQAKCATHRFGWPARTYPKANPYPVSFAAGSADPTTTSIATNACTASANSTSCDVVNKIRVSQFESARIGDAAAQTVTADAAASCSVAPIASISALTTATSEGVAEAKSNGGSLANKCNANSDISIGTSAALTAIAANSTHPSFPGASDAIASQGDITGDIEMVPV